MHFTQWRWTALSYKLSLIIFLLVNGGGGRLCNAFCTSCNLVVQNKNWSTRGSIEGQKGTRLRNIIPTSKDSDGQKWWRVHQQKQTNTFRHSRRSGSTCLKSISLLVSFIASLTTATASASAKSSIVASSAASLALPPASVVATRSALFLVLAICMKMIVYPTVKHRILWPGSGPDKAYLPDYRLPIGSFGCPFVGYKNVRVGTEDFGPGQFYHKMTHKNGQSNVWKFFTSGKPAVVVAGYDTIRSVLNREFDALRNGEVVFTGKIVGTQTVRFSTTKREHQSLRRLVGSAMVRDRVTEAIPNIQKVATQLIERKILLPSSSSKGVVEINMEDLCHEFTLDLIWSQIIGLDLQEDEIPTFHEAVNNWLRALHSPNDADIVQKSMKAKEYLVSKIERKIEQLRQAGPDSKDSSTLSNMVFAVDKDSNNAVLTHQQIIDHTFLLLFGGSDTSAGTLTTAMLTLGLHPEAYEKVVLEQKALLQTNDDSGQSSSSSSSQLLTRSILDKNCTYVDSVIREALRITPIQGGSMKGVTKTILVDNAAVGDTQKIQIPAGWALHYDRYATHEMDPITRKDDGSHMDVLHGFVPERWLDETTRPQREYIPFGVGPRQCIGEDLGMVEMKIFLSVLARHVDSFKLVYPSVSSDDDSSAIQWRKRGLMAVPEKGVIISPSCSNSIMKELNIK